MSEIYLHGVRVIELNDGPRPIQSVNTSVIGIVGTAPDADSTIFPINTPVLIAGDSTQSAKLDPQNLGRGTLPQALDAIFAQIGAVVVVVRVDEGASAAEAQSNVIGTIDGASGNYTGIKALKAAKNVLGVKPRILCAPGFDHQEPVIQELVAVADTLRAMVYASGPNTVDADAIALRDKFSSKRLYICDPWVKVWDVDSDGYITQPPSARLAGLRAKLDNKSGFWHSISNQLISGISGTSRHIDFELGDTSSRANLLNQKHVGTIINESGYRVWGPRNCSSDTKWMYECVARSADIINDSILAAHLWAVDKGITGQSYFKDVVDSVQAYLRHLKSIGAIVDGECWANPELNTPANIAAGKTYFDFDFTPVFPAESVTFRSMLTDKYLEEIF
ncbi:phage tail sheath subtilisin-like domain-containing protein [Pseudoalteromonas luteoviolacea]|uniref:phage tail sheath subtilisin-like domain-containing protein n=1 Tax=Pseudoalteromonas luteoviolacea TaxID=43657 RepID=UPI0011540BE2|nr:phage tail sheath subtilisin-like domain-containing protein [Pseudoalteromonas luteoviolacea]TQF69542.1 phage tail protein [Pseudoalteromonas luteoviolacea]